MCLRNTIISSIQKEAVTVYPALAKSFKAHGTSREMTTALFLLRSVEIGISVGDLDLLTIVMVLDMWTEKLMMM